MTTIRYLRLTLGRAASGPRSALPDDARRAAAALARYLPVATARPAPDDG